MNTIEIRNERLRAVISTTGACVKELWYDGIQVGMNGITIGRYANRIGGSRFTLNGTEYEVIPNEGRNCLHGGPGGFANKEWKVESVSPCRAVFSLVSEDGDQGFPGELKAEVGFEITDDDALQISYSAVCDSPTVINMTNHLYFNLGEDSAADHILQINAENITETDEGLIPTGKYLSVEGTRFDFRKPVSFDPGYDDNFVLDKADDDIAAVLRGKNSGITMTVRTDQPGLQLYNTKTHICLEAQHFADSPNRPEFPSTVLLPGDKYVQSTSYTFKRDR